MNWHLMIMFVCEFVLKVQKLREKKEDISELEPGDNIYVQYDYLKFS